MHTMFQCVQPPPYPIRVHGQSLPGAVDVVHNQVLKCLAEAVDDKRREVNSAASKEGRQINFVCQGEKARPFRGRHRAGQLSNGGAWEMKADLIQQVVVPPHIVSTRLRPDMLVWSDLEKIVYLIELTVPWEDRVEVANELKKAKYTEMSGVRLRPVEISGRGLVFRSTSLLSEPVFVDEV